MVEKSVNPGESVTMKGTSHDLLGTPIEVGEELPSEMLTNSMTMSEVDLSKKRGKILFLSLVPSLDTEVCEAQTHYLAEEGDEMSPEIERITISRDTPFAQKRFAEESGLTDMTYLSDYKTGEFGRSLGLLIDDLMLLSRSIIIVDRQGEVRYIQVVPEITHLPDMDKAFTMAEGIAH